MDCGVKKKRKKKYYDAVYNPTTLEMYVRNENETFETVEYVKCSALTSTALYEKSFVCIVFENAF